MANGMIARTLFSMAEAKKTAKMLKRLFPKAIFTAKQKIGTKLYGVHGKNVPKSLLVMKR